VSGPGRPPLVDGEETRAILVRVPASLYDWIVCYAERVGLTYDGRPSAGIAARALLDDARQGVSMGPPMAACPEAESGPILPPALRAFVTDGWVLADLVGGEWSWDRLVIYATRDSAVTAWGGGPADVGKVGRLSHAEGELGDRVVGVWQVDCVDQLEA